MDMVSPGAADAIAILLEDGEVLYALLAEKCGGREACDAGAKDGDGGRPQSGRRRAAHRPADCSHQPESTRPGWLFNPTKGLDQTRKAFDFFLLESMEEEWVRILQQSSLLWH